MSDWTIYVLRGLTSGLFKIGRSQNVARRIREVASYYEPVELVATFLAPASTERALHKRFASSLEPSRRREWFHDDGAIRAWLDTLPVENRGSVVVKIRHRSTLSPEWQVRVSAAAAALGERKEKRQAEHARKFERRHGHAFVPGQSVPGCAACGVRVEGYAEAGRSRSATWSRRTPKSHLFAPAALTLAMAGAA